MSPHAGGLRNQRLLVSRACQRSCAHVMLSRSGGRTMRNQSQTLCALRLLSATTITMTACGPPTDVTRSDEESSYIIALGSQDIDTRNAAAPPATTDDDRYTLVKFPGPVTPA